VLGGTGATGCLLMRALVERGRSVLVIARNPQKLPADLREHNDVRVVAGTALGMTDEQLAICVRSCDSAVSCLGHSMNARGVFGPPYRLVRDSLRRVCRLATTSDRSSPMRVVLMSSTGCRDRAAGERTSLAQRAVVGAIRALVPPHADNEAAMAYLQREVGTESRAIEWAIVRPDGLTNEDAVTPYSVYPSPTRSAIFNAGKTSRVNAADLMARLICEDQTWAEWVGRAPVIYNREG